MIRHQFVVVLLLSSFPAVAAEPVLGDRPVVARVTSTFQGVEVFDPVSGVWAPAEQGAPVFKGQRFRTGPQGRARVELIGGDSVLYVGSNSDVGVDETLLRPSLYERSWSELSLREGTIRVRRNVNRFFESILESMEGYLPRPWQPSSSFSIRVSGTVASAGEAARQAGINITAGGSSCTVVGSENVTSHNPASGVTTHMVDHGLVSCSIDSRDIDIRAQQMVTIRDGEAGEVTYMPGGVYEWMEASTETEPVRVLDGDGDWVKPDFENDPFWQFDEPAAGTGAAEGEVEEQPRILTSEERIQGCLELSGTAQLDCLGNESLETLSGEACDADPTGKCRELVGTAVMERCSELGSMAEQGTCMMATAMEWPDPAICGKSIDPNTCVMFVASELQDPSVLTDAFPPGEIRDQALGTYAVTARDPSVLPQIEDPYIHDGTHIMMMSVLTIGLDQRLPAGYCGGLKGGYDDSDGYADASFEVNQDLCDEFSELLTGYQDARAMAETQLQRDRIDQEFIDYIQRETGASSPLLSAGQLGSDAPGSPEPLQAPEVQELQRPEAEQHETEEVDKVDHDRLLREAEEAGAIARRILAGLGGG